MKSVAKIFLPSIARLSEYVRQQYDCAFNFQDAENLQSELELNPTLEERLHNESIVIDGDWVCFPIFSSHEQRLIGVARISRSEQFRPSDLTGLEKIIQLVFESRLSGAELLHNLEMTADNLQVLKSGPSNDKKIIQLSRYKKNLFPLSAKADTAILNFPFLIQAVSVNDIFKMAIEIHTQSQRYAFLSLHDLDPTALETADSIKNLGDVTIFVPDITALTLEQQTQVERYYSSQEAPTSDPLRAKLKAQFIVGTTRPVDELKVNHKVSHLLLSQLMVGYLSLSQPFSSYKRENMLEFFFDSLSGRAYHE